MMRELGDNSSTLDLKCDFPARESFREELHARLLAVDAQKQQETASGNVEYLRINPEARELDDSELDMLAAAQGDYPVPEGWLGNDSTS